MQIILRQNVSGGVTDRIPGRVYACGEKLDSAVSSTMKFRGSSRTRESIKCINGLRFQGRARLLGTALTEDPQAHS